MAVDPLVLCIHRSGSIPDAAASPARDDEAGSKDFDQGQRKRNHTRTYQMGDIQNLCNRTIEVIAATGVSSGNLVNLICGYCFRCFGNSLCRFSDSSIV
jgi:hypothetical protein